MDNLFVKTLILGAISGMRSMSALALTSRYLSRSPDRKVKMRFLNVLNEPRTADILTLLAIGELIADKLPIVPDRVEKPALFGRGLTAGIAGAALYDSAGRSAAVGGIIARSAALLSTFFSYKARMVAAEKTHFPDPLVGVLEDMVVYLAGVSALTLDE